MTSVEEILSLASRNGLTLRPDSAVLDDSGWDFMVVHAVAVDGEPWILRVPRRPDAAALIPTEQRLLELLHGRFRVEIPNWRVATPELVAYPKLPGEKAAWEDPQTHVLLWRIDQTSPPVSYVDALGQFMAQLHATSTAAAATTGVPVRSPDDVRCRFAAHLEFGEAELGMGQAWRTRGRRWLDRDDLWAGPMVLLHGDLHPGHTLVDADGALLGVLDWADAQVGHPGQEFVEAAREFGPTMLDQLLSAYGRGGGAAGPSLREHAVEAIAFAPLALAVLGAQVGKPQFVDAARREFA
jgi:macrolide phosphotransferase